MMKLAKGVSGTANSRRSGRKGEAKRLHDHFAADHIIIGDDWLEDFRPVSCLDVPDDWADRLDGDFTVHRPYTREKCLQLVAEFNRGEMSKSPDSKREWAVVFHIGRLLDSSCIHMQGGCRADFLLDVSLAIVIPTDDEIARFGKGA